MEKQKRSQHQVDPATLSKEQEKKLSIHLVYSNLQCELSEIYNKKWLNLADVA